MGNFLDGILAVASLVAVFTILLLGMYLFDELKAAPQIAAVPMANQTANEAQDWLVQFDGLMVFGFFSLMIFTIIVAYLMPSSTVFAALTFIVMIVSIPIIEMFKDFVDELIATPQFASYVAYYPMTLLLVENSTVIVVVTLLIAGMIQYGKGYYEGGRYI